MKKLMVLDGNSIVNRAFYGVSQNLTTREGQPTNAIFGFLNILNKLLDDTAPDALCVTFDRSAPTFRHLAYDQYKANRKGMPEELASQMPILKDVLRALNIPMYELDGWEADDLLGTIARLDQEAGWATAIVTGDKDALQLVTEATTVKLVSTRMGRTTTRDVTPDSSREEYGFDPIHMIDLKALMGDSSDNYPGVKGVGEKTAMALIQLYHSIDCIYERLPDIEAKPAVIRKLTEGEADARLSYGLAVIRRDAPMGFDPADAKRRPFNESALYQLLLNLEFTKLIDKLKLTPGPTAAQSAQEPEEVQVTVVPILTAAGFEAALPKWEGADCAAVLPLPGLAGVAVSLSGDGGKRAYLYDVRAAAYQGDYHALLSALFGPRVKKAAHGVKELCRALLDEGIDPEGFVFDTELAAYLLDPTAGSYEIRRLAASYFKKEVEQSAAYKEETAFSLLDDGLKAQTAWYEDVAWIEAFYGLFKPKLEELGLMSVLMGIELPLCPVLARMEKTGVLVDGHALADFGRQLQLGIDILMQDIYSLAGEEFNILSPKQLGHILFDKLGLPPVKKTKTGYSTNADVMEKLRSKHPIVGKVLDYRQLTKLKSTYVDGLEKVIPADGRIHTSFQNTVTATGRLSSTEPNLQNIPVRTPSGAEMRKMFTAPKGKVLVDADYSQIELRLLAHMSGDSAMIDGFNSGVDIHTVTASQVFGLPQDQVPPELRRAAKAVNFGIVYGISAFSLSDDIHVSVAQAKEYMEKYFEHYSGVRAYMNRVVEQGREDGYVSTMYGRRRWLPELKSSNFNTRSFGERVALNMPIQGTAADIIKLAMIRVDSRLRSEGLEARLVLQVHDELIVECPEEEAEQVKALLQEEMEGVAALSVPLVADAKAGRTWAECH